MLGVGVRKPLYKKRVVTLGIGPFFGGGNKVAVSVRMTEGMGGQKLFGQSVFLLKTSLNIRTVWLSIKTCLQP